MYITRDRLNVRFRDENPNFEVILKFRSDKEVKSSNGEDSNNTGSSERV